MFKIINKKYTIKNLSSILHDVPYFLFTIARLHDIAQNNAKINKPIIWHGNIISRHVTIPPKPLTIIISEQFNEIK